MPLPSKRYVFESALDQPANRPGTVLVLLAVDYPGVQVPEALASQAKDGVLSLRFSYRYRLPIETTHEGIEATLTHNGTNYPTVIPWAAVGCMVEDATGCQTAWRLVEPEEGATPATAEPVKRPRLRLIVNEEQEDADVA